MSHDFNRGFLLCLEGGDGVGLSNVRHMNRRRSIISSVRTLEDCPELADGIKSCEGIYGHTDDLKQEDTHEVI